MMKHLEIIIDLFSICAVSFYGIAGFIIPMAKGKQFKEIILSDDYIKVSTVFFGGVFTISVLTIIFIGQTPWMVARAILCLLVLSKSRR